MRCLIIIFAVLIVICIPASAQDRETIWYSLTFDGVPIGHTMREVSRSETGSRIVDSRTFGQTGVNSDSLIITTDRNAAGDVTSMTLKEGRTSTVVKSAATHLNIVSMTRYGSRDFTLPRSNTLRFDYGEGLLADWAASDASRLEVESFNIHALTIERLVFTRGQGDEIIRQTYSDDILCSAAFLTLNDAGEINSLTAPLLTGVMTRTLSNSDATIPSKKPRSDKNSIGLKSPFQIPSSALSGHIRFAFEYKTNLRFPVPQTANQSVLEAPQGVIVDICKGCGLLQTLSDADRALYLSPSLWIESAAPQITRAVKPVLKGRDQKNLDDFEVMNLLGRRVRMRMKDVNFSGHYSAVQSLRRRRGDCTEDAVVLTAYARAAGIPSRVASGLVYSRERYHGVTNVFVSHTWMQAYIDGQWNDFDISMDGFDASHIALAIGDGDPALISAGNNLGGLISLKSLAQIQN